MGEALDAHQLLGVEPAVGPAELGVPLARDLADLAVVRHLTSPVRATERRRVRRLIVAHPAMPLVDGCRRTSAFGSVPRMPLAPRALLAGLVDDAAVFPPGQRTVAVRSAPITASTARRPYGDLIGPFLCPVAPQVDELRRGPGRRRPRIGLSPRRGRDRSRPRHHALRVSAADPRLVAGRHRGRAQPARRRRDGHRREPARRLPLVASGLRRGPAQPASTTASTCSPTTAGGAAKYRTGGTTADGAPDRGASWPRSCVACAERALPFKLTAGLHHAVRSTDADDGLRAARRAQRARRDARWRQDGADADDLAVVLGERDADPLLDCVARWPTHDASPCVGAFMSFGCCGVTDPLDELAALGLLGEDDA